MFKKSLLFISVLTAVLLPSFEANSYRIYRIAVDDHYPPFSVFNRLANHVEGIDVDMTQAICKMLNIECLITSLDFPEGIEALQDGQVDLVCSGPGFPLVRDERIIWSENYFRSTSVFVGLDKSVNEDFSQTLKGLRIGAVQDSVQAEYLSRTYSQDTAVVEYKEFQDIMTALILEEIDFGFVDIMATFYYFQTDRSLVFDIFGHPVNTGDGALLLMLEKESEMMNKINSAIIELRSSDEYETIAERYFDFFIF
ncbi:MAG: transporter substrate-binding domain-containing protein [Deltaproteobacteria bacterium]|jgi:ABC-type amino acid transport substrate-binding protein|nr:transporter substrate-binding domain-containing protein [Deltaproteobacteria bacterium]